MSDLKATIEQSIADKIVNSVKYPFTVFEHRKPFEGFRKNDEIELDGEVDIDSEIFLMETNNMLSGSFSIGGYSEQEQDFINLAINSLNELRALRENFEECLAAYKTIEEYNLKNPEDTHEWDGPTVEFLNDILKDIDDYEHNRLASYKTLSSLIEIKAQVTWIRITLGRKPNFNLHGQRFGVDLPSILPSGTAEVWAKHKWLKCVKYVRIFGKKVCVSWRWTTKLTKLLSLTLNDIKLKVNARAFVKPLNTIVNIYGVFEQLRLDYKWIDKIPLEKLANRILGNKPISVFDASIFVQTIPVLNSSFRVSKLEIPNESGKISVHIWVESE